MGFSGATFVCTKPGWGRPQGAEGTGWIALALVIFGGWHPLKAAIGAYLFSFLQLMGIYFQGWLPAVPVQVFQVAPFPLMIFTLLIMSQARTNPSGTGRPGPAGRGTAGFFGNGTCVVGQALSAGLNQSSVRHSGNRLRTLKCDEPASILNFCCTPVQLFMTLWIPEFRREKFGKT